MQCKLSLNEKLEWLRTLDEEILTLVPDDDIEMEIGQADTFKECIHQALFHIEHKISAKQPVGVVSILHSVVPTDSIPASTDTTVASSDTTVITATDATMITSPSPHMIPDTRATTDVTTTTVTPVTHHEVAGSGVKLPKIEPKKFNGDLTKWETFWSSFEASIHCNPTLTAVDKFH